MKWHVITCHFRLFMYEKFLIRQHVTEQNGLDSSRLPLSLFPHSLGFVQLWQDQVVSSSLLFLLFKKMCNPPQDDTATWNVPMTPDIETATKEPLVSIINSPLFMKLSYANTWCSNILCGMTASEMAWPDKFNCPLPKPLSPLPAL